MMQDQQQQTLVLEDVQKFALKLLPVPTPASREVLIRVGAVGICGTDLHIFHGLANYCRDARGIMVTVIAFNFAGDALRDSLDARLRVR